MPSSIITGREGNRPIAEADWFKTANFLTVVLMPFVLGFGGYVLAVIVEHDRGLTTIRSNRYTMADAKVDRDRTDDKISAISESVHRLEVKLVEGQNEILQHLKGEDIKDK